MKPFIEFSEFGNLSDNLSDILVCQAGFPHLFVSNLHQYLSLFYVWERGWHGMA